ncbi:S8 family serine peptidase, partial [Singulisphaera rosea]
PSATARAVAQATQPAPTRSLVGDGLTAPVELPPSRIEPPTPSCRRLRVFSFDPLLAIRLETLEIAKITIEIPWEPEGQLNEGPVGEYLEVIDYDPASGCFYPPVNLSHARLTAQDGLPPSESNPQFHQQMCYAVAMATISTFEKALGRVALWAPHLERDATGTVIPVASDESTYVPRLRIYPHALREANAFYDPTKHALLFGYFPSREQAGGETLPGGTVFTCLSFDIVAHETTHALLHGLHRYYLYPSNPDLLAFHEAFADAVALFQHFSHIDVVRSQIAKTRGDLKQENLLGQLAQQFGRAMGDHRGALRRYLDTKPDPTLYASTVEPHDRGAVLMAALFLAFQNIYARRAKDLYRIATGGTGKLPDGDIHPDLVNRLAIEASKSARHILNMCVRALDYVPPIDLRFGEYLRALITADYDLVRDDDLDYRVAVIDAFRSWGIYPPDVNVLDETSLLWGPPTSYERDVLRGIVAELDFTDWTLHADRRAVFLQMNQAERQLRSWIYTYARQAIGDDNPLGLYVLGDDFQSIPRNRFGRPKFEVHSIRPCTRIGPDGQQRVDLVAEIVQRRAGYFDPEIQKTIDDAKTPWLFSIDDDKPQSSRTPPPQPPDFWFRGGCSLIIERESGDIRYCVRKSVLNGDRFDAQREFEQTGALVSASITYFGSRDRNPFALLHTLDD